jgi:hypothetical protein
MTAGGEGWEEEPASAPEAGPSIEPHYSSVEDFVAKYLSLVTEVRLGGPIVWCSSSWVHPEAVLRLRPSGGRGEPCGLEAASFDRSCDSLCCIVTVLRGRIIKVCCKVTFLRT